MLTTTTIYAKLAWRNIFRHKRRTFIAGSAIGIGLASLIYVDALMIGMERNMIESATASFMGEGQIHAEKFRQTFEADLTVKNLKQVLHSLEQEELVERYTLRVMSLAMISSPSNVVSLSMIGVDPNTERYLSQIEQAIVEGEYLQGDNERQIMIGSKLAELLEVALGDRVVVTVAEAGTGDLAQELFRVSGIFRFNIAEFDRGMVFVLLDKAQQMLGLGEEIHEIALKFTNAEIGRNATHPFWDRYSTDGNEALCWAELMPQLEAAFALADFSTLLTAIILFGVVALGIVNTLFMSLYERMFEFGVLRAVGTRPLAMGQIVMFEAGALAIVSIALGLAFGLIITYIGSRTGIDYTGIEYAGVTFRELLYPVLQPAQFIVFPFWVFVFTIGIALYPAAYAARLTPAKAMRRSF